MKLGFIGGGNMASAIIGGLIRTGVSGQDMVVAECSAERRAWLQTAFDLQVEAEAAAALHADVLLLAVKPQQLPSLLASLPALHAGQLVLSVAAGVRAADISRWLHGHPAVVRAMPNTPALVGQGATGLYALPATQAGQRAWAEQILAAVGMVVWVDTEDQIDAVTAISGSGPAYVFYFIEALEQAAIDLGLPPASARQLTLHTFAGAARLALAEAATPAELRARVTSRGGTTERGIETLEQAGVAAAIRRAAQAAAARAAELGRALGADPETR